MSGTISISQTGIPAQISIVPGPGVAFAGQGAPGLGFLSATVDGNGHLQMLRSDNVTIDAGKVASVVAAVVPAGSSAATATPVQADVCLLLGGQPGGALVLLPGANQSRRIVNALAFAVPLYPPLGCQINALGAGNPLVIAANTTVVVSSPDGLAWISG